MTLDREAVNLSWTSETFHTRITHWMNLAGWMREEIFSEIDFPSGAPRTLSRMKEVTELC